MELIKLMKESNIEALNKEKDEHIMNKINMIKYLKNKKMTLIEDGNEIDYNKIIIIYDRKTNEFIYQINIEDTMFDIIKDNKTEILLEDKTNE